MDNRAQASHGASSRTRYKPASLEYLDREYVAGTPMKIMLPELERLEGRKLHQINVSRMARGRGLNRPPDFKAMSHKNKLTLEAALLKSFQRNSTPRREDNQRVSVVEKVRYPGGYVMGGGGR